MTMRQNSCQTRRGSAIVIAMMILAAICTMIYISTDSIIGVFKEVASGDKEEQCKAAAEAVASAREQDLVNTAALGDANAFKNWTSTYGQQWFGNCQVKWRIEPIMVYDAGRDSAGNSETQTTRQFIANYNPSDPVPTSPQQVNYNLLHFRIAAEAQYMDSSAAGDGTGIRAQALRWSQINVQNLFKFALFYAQEGRKGDLELSHGPDFTVKGGIHSNGAIYVGGGGDPTVKANMNTGGTSYLGPKTVSGSSVPITITGIDGIFRQRKKTNYIFLGGAGYPDAATKTTPDPTKIVDSSLYMTQNNRYLNSTTSGSKNLQASNDSHNSTWKTDSISRWGGWVRTRVTGATVVKTLSNLPELAGRPFEPQRLTTGATEGASQLRYWTDATMEEEAASAPTYTVPTGTQFMMNGMYLDFALGAKETEGTTYSQFNTAAAPNRFTHTLVSSAYPTVVGLILRELPAQSWPTSNVHAFTFTCASGTVYTVNVTTGQAAYSRVIAGNTATSKTTTSNPINTAALPAYTFTKPTGNPTLATVATYYENLASYVDYLRSQYQMFFGSKDISWTFFSAKYLDGGTEVLPVSEDWIYNRRVYWTQNKYSAATMPKQSIVTLNMSAVNDFIKNTKANVLDATYPAADYVRQHFSGLIYMHRTNRADVTKVGTGTFGDRWADPSHPELYCAAFRIARASSINWAHVTGGEAFGTSKTTIVTPNPMFLWGNINLASAATNNKVVPLAIMADNITVLSGSWVDSSQQATSVLSSNTIPTGGTTTYNCALVTNNWPVDPSDAYKNQYDDSSAHTFVGWLEGGTRDFTYLGSVVVLNSRRYCWGYNQGADRQDGVKPTDKTLPTSATLYGAPTRYITFNEDLSSAQGRPPYVLDGYSVARVANYVDLVR